ncbi:MAG: FlgD immunoglobulin-like domain containing protein [Candidatus Gracilibacteria bacterium]
MNKVTNLMSKASALLIGAVMFLMSVAPVGAYTLDTTVVPSRTALLPAYNATAPVVSNVSASPSTINQGEQVTITFTVDKAASLDVTILDIRGGLVKTITADSQVQAATHSYYWSGRNNAGNYVAAGSYRARVMATNTSGSSYRDAAITVGSPSLVTAPVVTRMTATPSTINPQNNEVSNISFYLDKQATVDLTVTSSSTGVVANTIFRGANLGAGLYTYYWSGKDGNGQTVSAGQYIARASATNTAGTGAATALITVAYGSTGTKLALSNVYASPVTFDPKAGAVTNVYFTANQSAYITVSVMQGTTLIKRLTSSVYLKQGNIAWDGKNTSGAIVAEGLYTYVVYATINGQEAQAAGNITVDYANVVNTLAITSHSAVPSTFDPQAGGTTSIRYATSQSAYTSVTIMNGGSTIVKALSTSVYGQSGSITWDGRNTSGSVVPEGTYSYVVYSTVNGQEARAVGSVTVDYGTVTPTNLRVTSHNVYPSTFNPYTQSATISYTLNKQASVNVRIRDNNAALVKTIFTGDATTGSAVWDGRDQWGSVVASNSYKYEIYAFVGSETVTAYGYVYVNYDGNGNGGDNNYGSAPAITSASVNPSTFNPYTQTTQLQYTLANAGANVTIQVLDRYNTNRYMITLADTVYRSPGTYYVTWNGRDASSVVVPEGTYTFQITVANTAGNDMRNVNVTVDYDYYNGTTCNDSYYCPTYNTRPYIFNDYATPNPFKVGYNSPVINFTLNTGARVTVIIMKDTATIRTITNNEFKNGGVNYVTWNGLDYNGNLVSVGTYTYKIYAENGYGSDVKTDYIYATSRVGETMPCGGFNDISISSPYCRAVLQMVKLGIFEGYSNGTFGATTPINRAETMKVILKALNKPIQVTNGTNIGFWDLNPGEWYMNYLYTGKLMGIINGYPDGSFKPADTVNRVELLKMFFRTAGSSLPACQYAPYEDTPVTYETAWYLPYVCYSRKFTLVDGIGSFFNPSKPMKRGDVASLFYRYQVQGLFNGVTNPPTYSPDSQYLVPGYTTPAY